MEQETAAIVAVAETESANDAQDIGPTAAGKMTDAERKQALDMVRPRAVRADKALASADEKVGAAATEVGRAHALIQAFQLWKAVKDENGKTKYTSYTNWYEGQGFLVSKSRTSQCVTAFKAQLAEASAAQVAEITDGVGDPAQLVSFFSKRQKGGTGRTVTAQGRAKVIQRLLDTFVANVYAALYDGDPDEGGTEVDPALTEAAQYLLSLEVSDQLADIIHGDEGTVEEAQAS
jgi:hypothetical protein